MREGCPLVLYTGAFGAGKASSLATLARSFDPPMLGAAAPYRISRKVVRWKGRAGTRDLRFSISTHRSTSYAADPVELLSNEVFAEETLVLRTLDSIVYVVDSRKVRFDANVSHFKRTVRDLEFLGRSLDRLPVVYQFNHRDAPDALPLQRLADAFSSTNCDHAESIAATGVGVSEALERLLRLLDREALRA